MSVVLCTYNGARFVAAQVISVLEQSSPLHEIVLSDDGSADDTVSIAEKTFHDYAESHPEMRTRMIVTRREMPIGVARNFESALARATGSMIALCDQDDVWLPEKLGTMTSSLVAAAPSLAHSDAYITDAAGHRTGGLLFDTLRLTKRERAQERSGRSLDVLLRRNTVTGAAAMVSAELVRLALPVPDAWIHDEWLAIVAAITGDVTLIEEPLLEYRQHGSNQIGVTELSNEVRFARLRAPRGERNGRLLARAEQLLERLPGLGHGPESDVTRLVGGKVAHERFRSSLPTRRVPRIIPIVREVVTGRYRQFGLGAQDVLRDLVQPAA